MPAQARAASGWWARLTWPEAKEVLAAGPILLLPIGSTEAHGPHLPLDTDVRISLAVADRAAAELARQGWGAWVLPALSYGLTDYGSPFPGNITVRPETLKALVTDVCLSLALPGAPSGELARAVAGEAPAAHPGAAARPRAIVLINSHLERPHVEALRQAVAALSGVSPVPVLFADHTRRRWVPTLSEEFQSASCHAGQYETSLMMVAAPGAVRPASRGLPPVHADLAAAMRAGRATFPEAGAPDAYCGAPAQASLEEGEAQLGALVQVVLTTVEESLGAAP